MTSGITKQALVRHRTSLIGPACTQALGAAVIASMMMAAHSVNTSLASADRREASTADALESMGVFLGNAIYLSAIIIGVTMSLAVTLQVRDIALLKSLGATPGQVRRYAVRQAVVVSVPASLLGSVLALPACALWLRLLTAHQVLPPAVGFHPLLAALFAAVACELVASVIGTVVATLRPSRLAPAKALTEGVAGRGPIGRRRVAAGRFLVAAGIVLSVVLSQVSAEAAANAGIFILLGESIGIGLLGPRILDRVVQVLGPRVGDGLARLALDELSATSRSFSGALIPLVLAIAFAMIQDGMLATARAGTGGAAAADRLMIASGTATMVLFAAVAAVNCLLTLAAGQRRDLAVMQLLGGSRADVLRIRAVETCVFAGTGLLLAGVITFATLTPLAASAYGMWLPRFSAAAVACAVLAVAGLTALGVVGPAAVDTRRPMATLRADA